MLATARATFAADSGFPEEWKTNPPAVMDRGPQSLAYQAWLATQPLPQKPGMTPGTNPAPTTGTGPNPQVNSYDGNVWANLPWLKMLQGQTSIGDFNKLGNVGTNVWSLQNGADNPAPYLPPPSSNNITRLNALRASPDAWANATSVYKAGNRNLEDEYARAQAPWQQGSQLETQAIRTR